MGDQQVPWAEGRRALVYERATGQWVPAVGVGPDEELPDGERPGWESWYRETDEEPRRERGWGWECLWHHETQTRLLPGQCPRCYEVGTHAEGCMVAKNLDRHVPRWLAPFTMQEPPPTTTEIPTYQVFNAGIEQVFGFDDGWFTEAGEPAEPTALGWVCIDDDGPTLAPWEV